MGYGKNIKQRTKQCIHEHVSNGRWGRITFQERTETQKLEQFTYPKKLKPGMIMKKFTTREPFNWLQN